MSSYVPVPEHSGTRIYSQRARARLAFLHVLSDHPAFRVTNAPIATSDALNVRSGELYCVICYGNCLLSAPHGKPNSSH